MGLIEGVMGIAMRLDHDDDGVTISLGRSRTVDRFVWNGCGEWVRMDRVDRKLGT
jgi:hypothetical protein